MTNTSAGRTDLSRSTRAAPRDASIVGPTPPQKVIAVSVILRRKNPLPPDALERRIPREEYLKNHAADPADFDRLRLFARAQGLAVDEPASSLARRTVLLRGTVDAMQRAFGVTLQDYASASGKTFHGFAGTVSVPTEIAPIVQAVFGLDNRPIAKPAFRRARAETASGGSFYPNEIASMYAFPAGCGLGQTVGIIELGGGYWDTDIATYFAGLNLTPPNVVAVSVDDGTNAPGEPGSIPPDSPDYEVALDIQVIGAAAPGVNIAVYFAPNSDQGFLDALTTAVADETNKPSVISISWGASETAYSQDFLDAFDEACESAGAMAITVTAASGDGGATYYGTADTVLFPASSPHVLACGGTRIGNGSPETVWNDAPDDGATGGGVSTLFPVPVWQTGITATPAGGSAAALTGRGVPDVSGHASPVVGYNILVGGSPCVVGGTSAVAPLWAGLIAICNRQLGTALGFMNGKLYKAPAPPPQYFGATFNDITSGNNVYDAEVGYEATPGWDACTGLGSPAGGAIAWTFGVPTALFPRVGALEVKCDGPFVIDIHALYKGPTDKSYTDQANDDHIAEGKTKTLTLKDKCTDPDIEPGDVVQCMVWVESGGTATCNDLYVYDPNGPTRSFKATGSISKSKLDPD
ncbi:MAG: S53 family peptidase [Rhizomicrobium sp.]